MKELNPTDEQIAEVLNSLAVQFSELADESDLNADAMKNTGEVDEKMISAMHALAGCARRLKDLIEVERARRQEDQKNSTAATSNNHDFLPPEVTAYYAKKRASNSAVKNRKKQAVPEIKHEKNSRAMLISTELDGNLLGERKGDFVEVNNHRGETVRFRQQGNLWMRHEPDEDAGSASDVADELASGIQLQPEKALQAKNRRQEKIDEKVDSLLAESANYVDLIDFANRNGASFSHQDYIFKLALNNLSSAEKKLTQTAEAWKRVGKQFGSLSGQCTKNAQAAAKRAKKIQSRTRQVKDTRLASIKRQMLDGSGLDGGRLNFLLEQGSVHQVQTEKDRVKTRGLTINGGVVVQEDYMDEHHIFIDKDNKKHYLTLHTHFRKKNAPLEEQNSSHLKHYDANGTEKNGPELTLSVLKKLHDTQHLTA